MRRLDVRCRHGRHRVGHAGELDALAPGHELEVRRDDVRRPGLRQHDHTEEVYAGIARRLDRQAKTRGSFAGVHVCPEDAADIPDLDEARLVILHPKLTHERGFTH
jgi:hypothetical protein